MARDHGFGCAHQMQGQMHVHVTEMDAPVPLVGHFFCHVLWQLPSLGYTLMARSRARAVPLFSVCVIGRVLLEVI
ncbi:hypothetical protein C3489_08980 [Streptomyces sp. Ru71]|nr:hypothetical protein C3489_08980 [Streptomyces sp. Ru71]